MQSYTTKLFITTIFSILLSLYTFLGYSQFIFNPTYGNFKIQGRSYVVAKIIDTRVNKELGYIGNDSLDLQKLVLEKNIEEILFPFLEKCAGLPPKEPINLVLKINGYKFGTRKVNQKTWAWFYGDVEFLIPKDEKYVKIFEVNKCVEAKGEANLNLLLGRLHEHFWNHTLTELNELNPKKLKPNLPTISKDSILLHKALPKIFTDSTLKDGVYWTFKEFLNNSPSISNFKATKEGSVYFLSASRTEGKPEKVKNLDDYWGYCENNVAYVAVSAGSFKTVFLPLARFGNTFEIVVDKDLIFTNSDRIFNSSMNFASNAFTNSLSNGLVSGASIGLAIGGILLSSLTENPSPRVMISFKDGRPHIVRLYRF